MDQPEDREQDSTRDQLRSLLWEACEIEQQLMVQYLFAAFTMKKRPDERCSPAQLESVRRWGSQVFMVARQEMEHLGLVMNMISAIGGEPYFKRPNFPQKLSIFYTSTGGYSTVKDPKLDAMFDELSATVDRDKQADIAGDISRSLHETLYGLPVVSLDAVYGTGPKVASFEMMDGNPYAGPFYYLRAK